MTREVRDFWGPVFASQCVEDAGIDAFLDLHAPAAPPADLAMPSVEVLDRAAARAAQNAPGPDRIPCAAWRRSRGTTGILFNLMAH
eukprot:579143-Pyramimonas_sp.AAC.1